MDTQPGTPPKLRADAEHNKTEIIRTARDAFAREGVEVSIAEIARRAGVGFATVQRRFPTKQSLIEAVLAADLELLGSATGGADGEPDPWQAFTAPISACCAHQAREPGLAASLANLVGNGAPGSISAAVADVFGRLADNAKAAGMLRPEITLEDILLLVKANAGVVANSPGHEEEASRRFMTLALDGLRTRAGG